jgi:hypothetical protein
MRRAFTINYHNYLIADSSRDSSGAITIFSLKGDSSKNPTYGNYHERNSHLPPEQT